jgi:phage terminase Nu1 subunit (DNA packaging protein)
MISTATSADITTVPDEDLEKEVKRRQEEREKLAAEQAKTPEHKEEQKVVDKNLAELAKLTPPVEVTPAKVVTPPKPATPPATK